MIDISIFTLKKNHLQINQKIYYEKDIWQVFETPCKHLFISTYMFYTELWLRISETKY